MSKQRFLLIDTEGSYYDAVLDDGPIAAASLPTVFPLLVHPLHLP